MVAAHVEADEECRRCCDEQEGAWEVDLCCAFDPVVVGDWWKVENEIYSDESESAHWCLRKECPVSVSTDPSNT